MARERGGTDEEEEEEGESVICLIVFCRGIDEDAEEDEEEVEGDLASNLLLALVDLLPELPAPDAELWM